MMLTYLRVIAECGFVGAAIHSIMIVVAYSTKLRAFTNVDIQRVFSNEIRTIVISVA